MNKPFSPRTLLARVRALLRRADPALANDELGSRGLQAGDLALDPENQSVRVRGQPPTRLTKLEYRLLQYLLVNVGHTLPAERLTQHVWGYRGAGDRQMLKQLMDRLRHKIERDPAVPDYVLTMAGQAMCWKRAPRRRARSSPRLDIPWTTHREVTLSTVQKISDRWHYVRTRLLKTVDQFDDNELDFRPCPASWSVRQFRLHIAHEENGEFNHGLLAQVHEPHLAYLARPTNLDLERAIHTPWGADYQLAEMVEHLIEHEIHHRAELSLILGMLGKQGLNA